MFIKTATMKYFEDEIGKYVLKNELYNTNSIFLPKKLGLISFLTFSTIRKIKR